MKTFSKSIGKYVIVMIFALVGMTIGYSLSSPQSASAIDSNTKRVCPNSSSCNGGNCTTKEACINGSCGCGCIKK